MNTFWLSAFFVSLICLTAALEQKRHHDKHHKSEVYHDSRHHHNVFGFKHKGVTFYRDANNCACQCPPGGGEKNRTLIKEALKELFSQVEGGLEKLKQDGVSLNLEKVYNAKNGAEALLYILVQVGEKEDLSKVFSKLVTDPQEVLKIIVGLGGGSIQGIDGIVLVIYDLYGVASGKVSIQELIKLLIRIIQIPNVGSRLSDLIPLAEEFEKLAVSQNKLFNNSVALKNFADFFQSLSKGNLLFKDLNISDILNLLDARSPQEGLQIVIKIVQRFGNFQKSLPDLIKSFFNVLNTSDSSVLKNLFPGVDLSKFLSGGNVLESIFKQYNISQILSSGQNLTEVFSKIPIFGNFLDQISKASNGVFNASSLNLENIFKDFGGDFFGKFFNQTQGWIQNIVGILTLPPLGGSETTTKPSTETSHSTEDGLEIGGGSSSKDDGISVSGGIGVSGGISVSGGTGTTVTIEEELGESTTKEEKSTSDTDDRHHGRHHHESKQHIHQHQQKRHHKENKNHIRKERNHRFE